MKTATVILSTLGSSEVLIILFSIALIVGIVFLSIKNPKAGGIVLVIIGSLSVLGALVGAANGKQTNFMGIAFVVLGAFLISRGNKKKAEEDKKKQWEQESTSDHNNQIKS